MKKQLILFSLIIMSTLSCTMKENTISLQNPLDSDRYAEVVELNYQDLTDKFGVPGDDQLFLFTDNEKILTSQYVDIENDGVTDMVLLEADIAANETKSIGVKVIPADELPEFPVKTNIRFAKHEDFTKELKNGVRLQSNTTEISSLHLLMEGPAWENDKVGFRNYFDLRNGMDIFGKLTDDMVLDRVGVHNHTKNAPEELYGNSYHELNDWGMDILKVGNSLGAGAIALYEKDSLFRIGDNGEGTFELLYEGPLRSELRFDFPAWKAGENTYNIQHYIQITAGSYAYKSSLIIDKKDIHTHFTTGIVNLHSMDYSLMEISPKTSLMFTHDRQAYNDDFLGLGLVMPSGQILEHGAAREEGEGITQTFFVKMNTEINTRLDYWFYALWATGNPDFADPDLCIEEIRDDVKKRENPLIWVK